MSGTLAGNAINLFDFALEAALIKFPRMIAGSNGIIVPDCVIEETSSDQLEITQHPVEIGSTISDHAYKKPREVTLRWSWSNSSGGPLISLPTAIFTSFAAETTVQSIFAQLLALQASRVPFTLYTGKSFYENMLIASLHQTTNQAQEYSLGAVIVCREVILVGTETVTVAPQSAQASPQTTSPVAQQGSISPRATSAISDAVPLVA